MADTTYDLLAEVSTTTSSSIVLNNIPTQDANGLTYKHLYAEITAFKNGGIILSRLNGNSSNNYMQHRSYYDFQNRALTNTNGTFWYTPSSATLQTTANKPTSVELYYPNYQRTTGLFFIGRDAGDNGYNQVATGRSGGFLDTTAPLTSIEYYTNDSQNFELFEVRLYGMVG